MLVNIPDQPAHAFAVFTLGLRSPAGHHGQRLNDQDADPVPVNHFGVRRPVFRILNNPVHQGNQLIQIILIHVKLILVPPGHLLNGTRNIIILGADRL